MEQLTPPDLIWLPEPITECLFTGDRLDVKEVDLTVIGPGAAATYSVSLAHSSAANLWYGLYDDLDEILVQEDWSDEDVSGFRLHRRGLTTAIWVGPETGLTSWETYIEYLVQAFEAHDEPVDPEEVRHLGRLSGIWEVIVKPAGWIGEDPDEVRLAYVGLVLDEHGNVRGTSLHLDEVHSVEALEKLVASAAVRPLSAGKPGRPREVHVADRDRAQVLAERLKRLDIPVNVAETISADAVIREALQSIRGPGELPYYSAYSREEVQAFFDAARVFYRVRPWQRTEGHKLMAYRLDDGPWQYLSVMGQMAEDPGISVFDDWLHVCRTIHNRPDLLDALLQEEDEALGFVEPTLEGLTLGPRSLLTPEDGAFIIEEGFETIGDKYPILIRYSEGDIRRPRLALPDYRLLLMAIVKAVEKRRATPITSIRETLAIDGRRVILRYPAKGDEALPERAGTYRITLDPGREANRRYHRLPEQPVEIDAAGAASMASVVKALDDHLGGYLFTAAGDGAYTLLSMGHVRRLPAPYVVQMADLEEPWLQVLYQMTLPIEMTRLSDEEPSDEIVIRAS